MECGCPSTQVAILGSPKPEPAPTTGPSTPPAPTSSSLGHWPVKLRLVPESAPFLEGAHLLVLADCAAVAAHDLHQSLLKDKAVVILCPKFEDPGFYRPKMRALVAKANLSAITVAHMEVPCCSGLYATVKEAVEASGKNIPLERLVLSRDGKTRRI